jgi:hypothetical protein
MPYQTHFIAMPYPDESGHPCALKFRIAFTPTAERLAIVHLRSVDGQFQSPMTSYIVRDQILNRILDNYLRGVSIKSVRLVVQDDGSSVMFPIEMDFNDYIKRGNPYESSLVSTGRGRFSERVSIRSEFVVSGRARVHTSHGDPVPVPKEIARVLR